MVKIEGNVIVIGIWNSLRTEGNDKLMAAIQPKGLTRELALLVARENHGPGLTQGNVHRPRPGKPFFEVLERESSLKPRIQHAVGKHKIGRLPPMKRKPNNKEMEAPDPFYDNNVIFLGITTQPIQQAYGKELIHPLKPKRINLAARIIQVGGKWRINGCNVNANTWLVLRLLPIKRIELLDTFNNTTNLRGNRLEDV